MELSKTQFNQKTLENGMRIIAVPMTEAKTVTVLAMVRAGSEYETKTNNGVSHFLEHLFFKGTKKRSNNDIIHELDLMGAESNAFTAQEFTGYYARASKDKFIDVLDIISDIFINSTFPESEIEKERGVIIGEIEMQQDTPTRYIDTVLQKLFHGDQPAGLPVLGTKEAIGGLQRSDFLAYYTEYYVASAATIVVAGNIGDNAISIAEKYFKDVPEGTKTIKLAVQNLQERPRIGYVEKNTDQTHFAFGIQALPFNTAGQYVIDLISVILGQGMSSRLQKKLREEMGACYYLSSSNDAYADYGMLTIGSGVHHDMFLQSIHVILEECKKLKTELVSEAELYKAKEYIAGIYNVRFENNYDLARWYGQMNSLGQNHLESPEEYIDKIKQVTSSQIQEIANSIFKNEKMSLAYIGPMKFNDRDIFVS